MSRPIDADALIEFIDNRYHITWEDGYEGGIKDACVDIIKEINKMPTIKRKTGKWIERNPQNSDKCRLIECNKCGFSHIVGFNVPYEHWIENRNFCERCGADMRGTEE